MKKSPPAAGSKVNPASIAILALAVILGLLQATVGFISMNSNVQLVSDYHREIKNQYQAFANTFKFAHAFINRFNLALYMRLSFGAVQILGGSILAMSSYYKDIFHHQANYMLAAVNLIILGLQLNTGVSYEFWFGNLVSCILLVTRLILVRQQLTSKKMSPGVKTRNEGKPKTSTPKKKQT